MKCKKKTLLYTAHIIVPLILGFGVYVHSTGDTYITEILNRFLPGFLTSPPKWDTGASVPTRLLRFYFCDAAWAYALTFSIAPLVGTTKTKIYLAVIQCSCFSIFLELMQLSPRITGTFDPWDLIAEVLACIIAGTIYFKQFGRK